MDRVQLIALSEWRVSVNRLSFVRLVMRVASLGLCCQPLDNLLPASSAINNSPPLHLRACCSPLRRRWLTPHCQRTAHTQTNTFLTDRRRDFSTDESMMHADEGWQALWADSAIGEVVLLTDFYSSTVSVCSLCACTRLLLTGPVNIVRYCIRRVCA